MTLKIMQKELNIGSTIIKPKPTAKNLGCVIDSELTLEQHVNSITKSCFYQLRQIRSIHRLLSVEASKALIHAFISSRINYCNSVFYGATGSVLGKLQSVQNAAARLLTSKRRYDHITPVLMDLHWLPIHQRINYKIASLTRGCLHGEGHGDLKELLTPTSSCQGRAHLRAASHGDLVTSRSTTKRLGTHSFRIAAPTIWNSLPVSVRNLSSNHELFNAGLKTHLFNLAYT